MGGTTFPAISDFKLGNCNHPTTYLVMLDAYNILNVHSYDDLDGSKFRPRRRPPYYVKDPDQPTGAPINTYLEGWSNTLFLDSHVTQGRQPEEIIG